MWLEYSSRDSSLSFDEEQLRCKSVVSHTWSVSQANYANIFKKVHDHVKDCLPRHQYSRIISTLIPLKRCWRRKVKKNNLLRETFFHLFGDYNVPADYPRQTQLNRKQRLALMKIGLNPSTYNHPSLSKSAISFWLS
ncbi:hypothetical protein PVAP13_9NG592678 [Panicum virgatum]|uniref:Uncharacterized protein n=1 Tax=Panicum virgatum TaxID=38727 RepID=A0A8T0MV14_PANVG|nr:hypothetical protein PVAP13_9NG592678 [Panicum virgatum]